MLRTIRYLATSLFLAFPQLVWAASDDKPFAEATMGLRNLFFPVVSVLHILFLVISAFAAVGVARNFSKGEKDAAWKLVWWLAALVVVTIALDVLKVSMINSQP